MPKGVPSSFQENDPWPVYIERGKGAQVWDVDGNEYIDFHNGFGVMCIGHANPTGRRGGQARASTSGTHFAAPTEGSIGVAEELRRRFGLPQWRFTNSGTESTMDAIHIARGRDRPRHDPQDRGLLPRPPRRGDGLRLPGARGARRPRRPGQRSLRRGLPACDDGADARRPVQRRRRRSRACWSSSTARSPALIMEPAMMNINIIPPVDGYLERRARADRRARRDADLRRGQDRRDDLARRRDAALRRHARHGHAREGELRRLPGGAVGMTDELAAVVADGTVAPVRDLQRQPARDGGRRTRR